jgi:hypothetical protein
VAFQDRAECVPVALRCRAASWEGRVRARSVRTRRVGAGLRGGRCRPAPASRGARRTAGTSATGNFAARVEGPLVRRDQRRAWAEPVGRRGSALPRTAGARAKSGRWTGAARAGSRRATRCVEVAARGECRKARCRCAGARGRRSACSRPVGAPVSPHWLVSDSGGQSAAGDRRRCEIVEGRWEAARASPRATSWSTTNDAEGAGSRGYGTDSPSSCRGARRLPPRCSGWCIAKGRQWIRPVVPGQRWSSSCGGDVALTCDSSGGFASFAPSGAGRT